MVLFENKWPSGNLGRSQKIMAINKKYVIGIDIGGSKINAIVFNDGKILKSAKILTPKKSRKEFLEKLEALVRKLVSDINNKKILGIGCGVAGILDLKKNLVLNATNIKILNNFNIRNWIGNKFGCRVEIDNDSRSFTRAEYLWGAGKAYKNIIGMTLGTGIGGGIIIGGKMLYGSFGSAGEIGHMINGEIDLEDLVIKAIKNFGFVSSLKAYESAKAGNKKAREAFKKFGRYLGIGIANLVNILDPEAVIIGGGIASASEFFLPETKKTMTKFILSPKSRKNVKILIGKLGENAGAMGAAALFYEL